MFLRSTHVFWAGFLLASSFASGCTGDLGTPDYSDDVGLRDPIDPFPPVPPDPFEPGDERLSVGFFYEGRWSAEIPINQINTNYFIFAADDNNVVATLTFSQDVSSDRMEGLESVQITLTDQPFWGGGIIWDNPTDLSEWTWMFVGFKSSDRSFESFDLTLQSGAGEAPSGVVLDPADYGYVNDGEWHFLQIPLQDAIDRGFDPSQTRSPFIISAAGGRPGDELLIDNLYFTKEPPAGGGTGGTGGTAGTGGSAGTGGTGGTAGTGGTPAMVLYEQDFESLDDTSPTALGDDGWLFFGNVFDSSDNFKFGYGPMGAPNATVSPSDTFISAVASGEGDTPQGTQQLSVFSDYNCCGGDEGHFNGTDRVDINVFQEINPIPSSFIGRTLELVFDAKQGNIEGATTASAFIKTLDPNAGFSETNLQTVDTTSIPATWDRYSITLDLTDPLLEGQILQFGFQNTASNFEGSGIFYDNVEASLLGSGGIELRPLPEIYTTGKAINYSAFRAGGPAVGEMPSDEDILEDLGLLNTNGYDLLRLFGGDAVSERILQLAEANYPEMRFQQGLFLEGLSGAAATNCDSTLNDSQVATAIRLANTYSNVVTVSVGNETSFFSGFMPLNCLEGYITETRNNVTQPVTADDDYTFYAGETTNRPPDTVLPLIDFVAIHMYPITNYRQWDWKQEGVASGPLRAEAMMNKSLAVAQANYQAVYDYEYLDGSGTTVTIGETFPIVVGETGWKWRQTNIQQEIETYAANPVNAKWYYDLMLGWERSPGGPPTIFIFNSFDETWKTTDDGWGFWDELRMPLYVLCDTPAGSACNDPVYQGAGFFP